MAGGKKKTNKRPDTRPARTRYWESRKLEEHKVRHLVKYCKMTKEAALRHWRKVRQTRMKLRKIA